MRFDVARRIHFVPCDLDISSSEFDSDIPVQVNGESVASVSTSRTWKLVSFQIRDLSIRVPLRAGETLFLQDIQERDNLSRRRRAIDRVLSGEAEIPDLLQYLDPSADIEPLEMRLIFLRQRT